MNLYSLFLSMEFIDLLRNGKLYKAIQRHMLRLCQKACFSMELRVNTDIETPFVCFFRLLSGSFTHVKIVIHRFMKRNFHFIDAVPVKSDQIIYTKYFTEKAIIFI